MMSEVAESTATDTGAVEAPSAPAEATTETKSRQEARQGAHEMGERYAARLEAAGVDLPERDEGGKFVAAEQEGTEAEAAIESPGAEAPPEDQAAGAAEASATEQTAEPPEGFVRVEYPEGHFLRETQGIAHRDVPVALERDFRAMLNSTHYRRNQVTDAQAETLEARAEALALKAELDFMRDPANDAWTGEHQKQYEEMVGAQGFGQEAADSFKAGVMATATDGLQQARQQAQVRALDETWQSRGREFRVDAYRELPSMYPGVTQAEIEVAIGQYAGEVREMERRAAASGMDPMTWTRQYDYSGQDLIAVAGEYLKTRPGVIASQTGNAEARELERRQIQADEKARQKAELQEAAGRHATNPNRNLGGLDAGQRSVDPTPERESNVGKTTGQVRDSAKARLRALGERIAGAQ